MGKYEMITDYLVRFLDDEVRKTGLNSVVLGLSGGIDSAVVAVLAHRAFGDDLLCVKMPSHYSSQRTMRMRWSTSSRCVRSPAISHRF